ncbi:hypothetical protein Syun_030908 [Stephania yunnanensis]|uniref:Uncharacterized protein n=1 Tax=Stephania yunnanensis TaxID=152371 RepID=A0AAP0HG61_9MAGN
MCRGSSQDFMDSIAGEHPVAIVAPLARPRLSGPTVLPNGFGAVEADLVPSYRSDIQSEIQGLELRIEEPILQPCAISLKVSSIQKTRESKGVKLRGPPNCVVHYFKWVESDFSLDASSANSLPLHIPSPSLATLMHASALRVSMGVAIRF